MHADVRLKTAKNQELFKFAIIIVIVLFDSAVMPNWKLDTSLLQEFLRVKWRNVYKTLFSNDADG